MAFLLLSMMRQRSIGAAIGVCRRSRSLMISLVSATGLGVQRMVSMAILFAERVTIHLRASFSPAPVTATGLRSTMPVRSAATGRQFRTRAATPRGASTSIRATTTRATTTATTGSLFALSKGSPNSEHKRAYPILQFFNSFRSLLWHPLRIEKGNVVERPARPFL